MGRQFIAFVSFLYIFGSAGSSLFAQEIDLGSAYMLDSRVGAPLNLVKDTLITVRPVGSSDLEVISYQWSYQNNQNQRRYHRRLVVPRSSIDLSRHTPLQLQKQGSNFIFSHPRRDRSDYIITSSIPVEYCQPVEEVSASGTRREDSDDLLEEIAVHLNTPASDTNQSEDRKRIQKEIEENFRIYTQITKQNPLRNRVRTTEEKRAAFAAVLTELRKREEFQGERGSRFFEIMNIWLEVRGQFTGENPQPQEAFWVQHSAEVRMKNNTGMGHFARDYGEFGNWLENTPARAILHPDAYSGWNANRNDIVHIIQLDSKHPIDGADATPDQIALRNIIDFYSDYKAGHYSTETGARPSFTNYYHPKGMKPRGTIPRWADNPRLIRAARARYEQALRDPRERDPSRWRGYMRWQPVVLPAVINTETGQRFETNNEHFVAGNATWTRLP